MQGNKGRLRPATKQDYAIGLPTSREAAIKKGITRFINPEDNKEYVIRNYGSKSKPKGFLAEAGYRKISRGGGSKGSRTRNEKLSTPAGADKRAFGTAMITARQMGLVGDHNYSVARTGNALAEMSPERQALYHQRFANAAIPIGNQAANITPITEKLNQAKVGQERALDKAIKQAGSQEDYVYSTKEWATDEDDENGKKKKKSNGKHKNGNGKHKNGNGKHKNGNGKRDKNPSPLIGHADFIDGDLGGNDLPKTLLQVITPDSSQEVHIEGAPLFMKV